MLLKKVLLIKLLLYYFPFLLMISKNHKYYEALCKLELKITCPSANCISYQMQAYRFVYSDIKHQDNFLPQAIKSQLARRNPARRINEEETCNDYALSLYAAEESARNMFNGLPKRVKDLLGYSHIACGIIQEQDGVNTKIEPDGHFNLHENMGIDIQSRFKIVGTL